MPVRLIPAVAAALALLAPAVAHAAFDSSEVTTPGDFAVVFGNRDSSQTVSGTVTGGSTDPADIRCYFANGAGYFNLASGVPTTGGTFSATVNYSGGSGHCFLRTVNTGTTPSNLAPYAGPRVFVTGLSPVSVNSGGPNNDKLYGFSGGTALTYAVVGVFDAAGTCADAAPSIVDPVTLVYFAYGPGWCLDHVDYRNDSGPSEDVRSGLQVDGVNHYLPHHTLGGLYPGSRDVPGLPAMSYTPTPPGPDAATFGVEEVHPTVRCQTDAYPPTAGSCPSFPSGLVMLRRTRRYEEGARTWTTVDHFTSTDGQAHDLDVLYASFWDFDAPLFMLPGETTFTKRDEGFSRAIDAGPGTIISMLESAAPEGPETKISHTWAGGIDAFDSFSPGATHLRLRGRVPASGELTHTTITRLGTSVSELRSLAAQDRARLTPPSPATPSPPAAQPVVPGPPLVLRDVRAPLVTASLSSTRFPVGPDATAVTAQARGRARGGTTVRWSVDEPGTTTFAIARTLPGRRSGRRCVRPTRRLVRRRARRCTRVVARGTLRRRRAAAGRAQLRFSGRIGRRALPPGRYQMAIVATDLAGNRSRPRTLSFTVLRSRRR